MEENITIESALEMFSKVQQLFLQASEAAAYCNISVPHFRNQLRKSADGTEHVNTYKFGAYDVFLTIELDKFVARRAEIKQERENAKKDKKSGRKTELLNLNMLKVLAQHLQIENFSRMFKSELYSAVIDKITSCVDRPEQLNFDKMDFSTLMSLVSEIVVATEDNDEDYSMTVDDFLE